MHTPKALKPFLCFLLLLAVLVSTCSCLAETVAPVSKRESVADVTLEIRDGILYVRLNSGATYRTTIEADNIYVLRPDIGTGQGGSVVFATVMKDGKEVASLSQSYVASFMTKEEAEAQLGPLSRVAPDALREILITILVIALCVIVICAVVFVKKKLKKPARS